MPTHKWCPDRLRAVSATIDPEPGEEEREAILAVLAPVAGGEGAWAATALLEGVDDGEPDP